MGHSFSYRYDSVWHACVLLVIHGMAGVVGGPGSQLIIHDIVGREYLKSAVRLNSTGRNIAVLFGPAVGGATMMVFGPPCAALAALGGARVRETL